MFDLIFFDLDGTLVETAPEIADAVNDTLAQNAIAPVELEQVRTWIGHGTQFLLQQALSHAWAIPMPDVLTHPDWADLSESFKVHYKLRCGTRSHLYPCVMATLQALRAQGKKLVVVTNKETAFTEVVLDVHGLTTYFDRIYAGDTLPTKKPNPAALLACLQSWNIPAERALFVGDSSIDAQTAKAAGIAVWLLPYGYNMGEPLASAQPDRIIEDFSALLMTPAHH